MTSPPGGRPVIRVAADANVILSAVLGHAALKVFTMTRAEVSSTAGDIAEVREYIPTLARSHAILPEALEAQLRLLAIREYDRSTYDAYRAEAFRRMGLRDVDDVDLLALALSLRIPLWSNDSDFEAAGVEWYTTARLLAHLGIRSGRGRPRKPSR